MLVLGIYRVAYFVYIYLAKVMDLPNALVFLANGIAIIFIVLYSYKKAEKWSWWCLFLIGLLPLAAGTLWEATNPGLLIGWVIFLLGMFIPIKAFFGK